MASLDLKSPVTQKILLSGALSAVALVLFFFTHYIPIGFPNQREKIDALKVDYEKKSTELARARATVADLPRFEAEYETLHQRWSLAAELLPTDRQVAALLRKITLAAEQTGVHFVTFRPSGPKNEQYYTEMPLQITVNGGYHQIGSFLAELANLRRIITVSNVKLKQNSGSDPLITTQVDFIASAYSLNTAPTAPPPVATPSPPADTDKDKKEGAKNARKAS
jgi:type IV pilus assembly protein PilO